MDTFLQKDTISLVLGVRKQDDFSSSGIANTITLSRNKNRQKNLNDAHDSVSLYNDLYYNVVKFPKVYGIANCAENVKHTFAKCNY